MKTVLVLISSCVLLVACSPLVEAYIRNYSDQPVLLEGHIVHRDAFDRLPNKVSLYDTATRKRAFYGDWREQQLVTWFDSTHFSFELPAHSVIRIEELSQHTGINAQTYGFELVAIHRDQTDTLVTADYRHRSPRLQWKHRFFLRYFYTFDFR